MRRLIACGLVALASVIAVPSVAPAEPIDSGVKSDSHAGFVDAWINGGGGTGGTGGGGGGGEDPNGGSGGGQGGGAAVKSKYTFVPKEQYAKLKADYEAEAKRIDAVNAQTLNSWDACVNGNGSITCPRGQQIAGLGDFNYRVAGEPEPAVPPAATIPPQVLAYTAMARLKLTAPTPGIGPPPSINEWKMAAVGYPLWLWADGNLDPAPVSDSVYDVSVSLDARLQRVVFHMGDGEQVSCTNLTRRWTRSVKPGTESPACGYRYQKPSLPKGNYTVTAYTVWAVDWNINGTTGTLPFYQSSSVELPVGELQVLVR